LSIDMMKKYCSKQIRQMVKRKNTQKVFTGSF